MLDSGSATVAAMLGEAEGGAIITLCTRPDYGRGFLVGRVVGPQTFWELEAPEEEEAICAALAEAAAAGRLTDGINHNPDSRSWHVPNGPTDPAKVDRLTDAEVSDVIENTCWRDDAALADVIDNRGTPASRRAALRAAYQAQASAGF